MNRQVFWGAILVFAGSVLLLARHIPFSLWARLWPLLIVIAGLCLVWLASRSYEALPTEAVSLPLEDAERARITLRHGLGELHLAAGDDPELLLTGQFSGGVKWHREQSRDTAHVLLEPSSQSFPIFSGVWPRPQRGLAWRLRVNPETPLTIEAEGGLASSVYELTDLNVKSFRLKGGLASTVVNLPLAAGHTRVRVETGLASVRFNVPEGVAARIRTSGGLSSSDIDPLRFPHVNNEYVSPDYGEAANSIEMEVELGLGSLTVR